MVWWCHVTRDACPCPGSGVVVEDFVYSGTLSIMTPYQPRYHVVQSDQLGMRPQSLREVLGQWSPGSEQCPKILYINPTGANPTGDNNTRTITTLPAK